MRKTLLLLLCMSIGVLSAQNFVKVYTADHTDEFMLSQIDSISFRDYDFYEYYAFYSKGVYVDSFLYEMNPLLLDIYKSNKKESYRIMNPFDELHSYWGDRVLGYKDPYIEFQLDRDSGFVRFDTFYPGLCYNDGMYDTPIIGYYYSGYDYSCVLSDQKIKLTPYFYVPGVGNFGYFPIYIYLSEEAYWQDMDAKTKSSAEKVQVKDKLRMLKTQDMAPMPLLRQKTSSKAMDADPKRDESKHSFPQKGIGQKESVKALQFSPAKQQVL